MKTNTTFLTVISMLIGFLFLTVNYMISSDIDIYFFYKIPLIYGIINTVIIMFINPIKYNEIGLVLISLIPVVNFIFIIFGVKVILEELRGGETKL